MLRGIKQRAERLAANGLRKDQLVDVAVSLTSDVPDDAIALDLRRADAEE